MSAPDLSVCYAIHASLRSAAHRFAATAEHLETASRRQKRAYHAYWKGYAGALVAHHKVEDDYFFLALADRVRVSRDFMAQLSTEHHDLDELMAEATLAIDRAVAGRDDAAVAGEVLREFATRMDAHLDFEDANVLPLFAQFTAEEYSRLDEHAIRSLGVGTQTAFSVPFIASAVSADERERIMGDAPVPFRAVYRMTRRHHDRMRATAFGGEAGGALPATPMSVACTGAA